MKRIKIEIKWAIVFFLVTLVWMLGERLFGLHDEHIDQHLVYTNFFAIPAIAVYVFALLDKRKNHYQGYMTYIQGFRCGIILTLLVTLLSPLAQILTSLWITPHYFENAIQFAVSENKMEETEARNYFSLSNYIIQGVIGAPLMGLFTSLIVALFTRKEPKILNSA
ncbi:DUF4199 domain-containing protein [Pararhodonellum marinum]|uniref:DUF4199 domain-containing protein n=1 Tax=Pararhodonellum marinum TaxID=2755358 RepID=UPI0018900852|nr:DUF4199 domain-containing protein [Pararhodonellum marinum]